MRTPATPPPEWQSSAALTILQTVQNHRFSSLAEASAYLKSLGPEERFEAVNGQATKLVAVQERVDQCMAYLEGFAQGDDAFKDRLERDPEIWTKIASGANRARTSAKKKQQALDRCYSKWGKENVHYYFEHLLNAGENTWSKTRRLAMREADIHAAVERIRDAIFWRVTHVRPGRSAALYPLAADFEKTKDDNLPVADRAAISAAGYVVDRKGWLAQAGAGPSVREAGGKGDTSPSSLSPNVKTEKDLLSSSSSLSSPPSDIEKEEDEWTDEAKPDGESGLRLGSGNLAEGPSPYRVSSTTGDSPEGDSSTVDDQSSTGEYEADEEEEDGEEDESDGEWDEESRPAKRRRSGVAGSRPHGCCCAGGVPRSFLARCSPKRASHPGDQVRLVKEWARHVRGGSNVCFHHSKSVASAIGMQTRNLNAVTVKQRLHRYHRAILQNAVGDLKAGNDTYAWFRMADRPSRPSDRLGPYKLMPKEVDAFTISVGDQARLRRCWGIDGQEWDRCGSVVVDCFGWWATEPYTGPCVTLAKKTILDVVLEEFEMYHAHLRLINQKPNYGWLRNMYYSLGQQAMRQDPQYFAIYCALRPDQNTNLVSYPYYAKYAHEGDNTFFRHIDVNVKELATSGRGANMIQGSVSLDDEREDDCTMILPGMHRHIQAWDEVLTARGRSTGALVHRICDDMFTPDDEKQFDTQWTPQPCRRGQVRVTLPHLPHGAYGPAKGTRRTMLPWFCGLQSDLETLEVIEGGTWSDLSAAHRDMVAARLSPSGLPNRYGAIPFAFPAAVELAGLGALSDALVCRRRHDRYAVLAEKRCLLTGSEAEVGAYLDRWRKVAVNRVCEAFELVKEAEVERFGEKSYFYRRSRGLPPAKPDDDPDDDPDKNGDERAHGFEELEAESMDVN